MLIILFAIILILAMTALFVSQGLFTSMITAVMSVVCAAFALNAYPALATALGLYDSQGPVANGTALTALFVLSLIASKEAADYLVPKTVHFSTLIDRIGGGVFGLIASMTMVGMVLVILQLLPLGESILGYRPYNDALQRQDTAWPFFADDFAVAIGEIGSVGAFGGEGSFNDIHADLLREAAAARNTAGSGSTTYARGNSLMKIEGVYAPTEQQLKEALNLGKKPLPKDPLIGFRDVGQILVIGTRVDDECGDPDKWTRLAGTQFRLVARKAEGDGQKAKLVGPPIDHYPVAYFRAVDANGWDYKLAPDGKDGTDVGKLMVASESSKMPATVIYWVYELGKDERADYVTFRQVSTSKVSRPKEEPMPALPKPASAPAPKAADSSAKKTTTTKK